MKQPDVADKTPRLHAACALNGASTRKVANVTMLTTLTRMQDYGRQLGCRSRIRPDDKVLVAFRQALNSVTSMEIDTLSWRGKRAVATLVEKARALDLQLPN